MVGRRNTLLVTKRSLRNADSDSGKRPKRIIQTKLMEETVGMSRQEEQELNKALYASLQENRRSKSMPSLLGHSDECNNHSDIGFSHVVSGGKNITSANNGRHSLLSGSKSSKMSLGQRRSLRVGMASPLRRLKRTHKRIRPVSASPLHKSRSKLPSSLSIDESSQDSARSSSSSANGSKRKIHAQRKFAQGCSLPGTPSSTPAKLATPPVKKISSRIPKTEDFLTFLCFRGTSALPPHLDFFNYSREELTSQDEGPKSGSSNKAKRQREGTPDSSSTSSGANEEVAEAAENVNTPIRAGKGSGGSSLLAKRSAARASAGTPETARGIVSLRQGLQRKVSSSSSSRSSSPRFPVASNSSLFSQCQAQLASSSSEGAVLINPAYSNPLPTTRNCRPKFYFTPEKSPSPSKASGVRPGEFTPPSMHHGSLYFGSVRNFSPLVCRPSTSASASQRSTPAKGLYSSSSSSYPSSSRSSWSSTTTSGTPKRRKQGIIPLPREDVGKVTSVCTTTATDFSLSTQCNLIDFPSHSSLSYVSSSATGTLPSPSDILSVQHPQYSLVASSASACVLNPPVTDKPLLHVGHSDLPRSCISDIPSNFIHLGSNCHHTCFSSSRDFHNKATSSCHSFNCHCLNIAARCEASGVQERTLKSCHKGNIACPNCASNLSHHAHTQSYTNHITPLTLHGSPAYTAKQTNCMHNCDNINLMHGTNKSALHETSFQCLSNHTLSSDSCMQTICFQNDSSSVREENVLSTNTYNCPRSCNPKCISDANKCGFEKGCAPVDLGIHVSFSCMDKLPSLSGKSISPASEQKESSQTSDSYSMQWEVAKNYKKQNKTNVHRTEKELPARNYSRVFKRDVLQSRSDARKPPVYETDEFDDELVSKLQRSQSAVSVSDQQSVENIQFEEYDFAIINQEGCDHLLAADNLSTAKKNKRCKKDEKSKNRLKRKKHKKHCRKKIKITQAELRIPKLTIRISKKQKGCTLTEIDTKNMCSEEDGPGSKNKTNFQEEFIKMLEVTNAPDPIQSPENILGAFKEQKSACCSSNETGLLSDEEINDSPLLDYHGCISESEIFFSTKSSQVDESHAGSLCTRELCQPRSFQTSDKSNGGMTSQMRQYYSQNCSNLPCDTDKFHTQNVHCENKKQESSPATEVCFNAQGGEKTNAMITNLKMREEIIKTYSKFNTRDTIESNIEIGRRQSTYLDNYDHNFSANQFESMEADLISSGKRIDVFQHDGSAKEFSLKRPTLVLDEDMMEKEQTKRASVNPRDKGESSKDYTFEDQRISCKQKVNCKRLKETESRYEPTEDCPLEKIPNSSQNTQDKNSNAVEQTYDPSKASRCNSNRISKNKKSLPRNLNKKQLKRSHRMKVSKKHNITAFLKKASEIDEDSYCESSKKDKNKGLDTQDMQMSCKDPNVIHYTRFGTKTQEGKEGNPDLVTEKIADHGSSKLSSNATWKMPKSSNLELSSFEKGKTSLIDQILDWASIALTELASKCSLSVEESDSSIRNIGDQNSPISLFTSNSKHESEKLQKMKRRFSDSFFDHSFGSSECDRSEHKHVHKHRKKKRHKSERARHCRHCRKTKCVRSMDADNFDTYDDHMHLDCSYEYSSRSKILLEENSHIKDIGKFSRPVISLRSPGEFCEKNVSKKASCLQRQDALSETEDAICLLSPELVEVPPRKTNDSDDEEDQKSVIIDESSNNEFFENCDTSNAFFENTIHCELKNQESEAFSDIKKVATTGKDIKDQAVNFHNNEIAKNSKKSFKMREADDTKTFLASESSLKPAVKRRSVSEKSNLMKHQRLSPYNQGASESDMPLDLSNSADTVLKLDKTEHAQVLQTDVHSSHQKFTNKNCKKAGSKIKLLENSFLDSNVIQANQIKKSNKLDTILANSPSLSRIKEFDKHLCKLDQQQTNENKSLCSKFRLQDIDTPLEKTKCEKLIENTDIACADVLCQSDVLKITESKVSEKFKSASMTENSSETEKKANLFDARCFLTKGGDDLVSKDILLISENTSSMENYKGTIKSERKSSVSGLKLNKILAGPEKYKNFEPSDGEVYFSSQENVTDDEVFECNEDIEQVAKDIAVHSFGSLNTGQGFAVVNGRLEKCQILNKMHLAPSGVTECEKTRVSKYHSKNNHGATNQAQASVVQEAKPDLMKQFVFHSSGSSETQETHCKVQNSCTKNSILTAEAVKMKIPYLDCGDKDNMSKLDNKRLSLYQDKVSKCTILFQTRPQLQRSIYLQARDNLQNKKFKNFMSLDNSLSPSNERVKVFQKTISNTEPSLQFVEDNLKTDSSSSSSIMSSSNVNTYYQTKNCHSLTKDKPVSGKRSNFNLASTQGTNRGSLRPKTFDYSFCSHPAKRTLSFEHKEGNCLSSSQTQTSKAAQPPTNVTSDEIIHSYPLPLPILSIKCSGTCPIISPDFVNTLSSGLNSGPESVASSSQPSTLDDSSSQHATAYQQCSTASETIAIQQHIDCDEQSSVKGQYLRSATASYQNSYFYRKPGSDIDVQSARSSVKFGSHGKGANSMNSSGFNCSGESLNESETINKTYKSTFNSKSKLNIQESVCSYDKASMFIEEPGCSRSHDQDVAKYFTKPIHQKICHLGTINVNSNVKPMLNNTELSTQGGSPLDGFSYESSHMAQSKTNSNVIDYNHIKYVDMLPLDLSSYTDGYQQETAQTQPGYPLDIAFTSESLGLDMNLTDELQDSTGSNEHVLDAIMAELKLQIEHLKGEILQGQSQPSSGQAKESIASSSCYSLPS